jgi:BAG domain-containing protein
MQVKFQDPSSSGHAVSPIHSATSVSVSAPALHPVSPLTTIRAVRTRFSALESAFKFPPVLDFDHDELSITSNNAPVRSYENALNGLLERLDAIESDGNEEVRDVRREVVREVERALEEVERKVKEKAPQAPVPEVAKEEAGEVEREDPGVSATQDVPAAVADIPEATKPTLRKPVPVVLQADANIDVAISAEYQSASPVAESSEVAIAGRDSAAGTAPSDKEASTLKDADTEDVPTSEDGSDSITTITPAPVAPAVHVPSSSNESASTSAAAAETFLTSLSHDQFIFPPRPAFSQSSTNSGASHEDDAVLVDDSSEGGSSRGVEDEWTTEF